MLETLKFMTGAVVAAMPGAALACSCALPPASEEAAQFPAAAASVDLVVIGDIVADTSSIACRGPIGAPVTAYQTLKIREAFKGKVPRSIKVRIGEVTPLAEGCAREFSSCNVEPCVGESTTWSLKRKGDDWVFADYCTTTAVQRALVIRSKFNTDVE